MIETTKHEWGVRLIARPFSMQPGMEIQADVHKPSGTQRRISVSFRGTIVPLKLTDARIWRNTFSALLDEAEKVLERLGPRSRSRK